MIHRIGADDPALERYRHVGDPAWLRDQGLFVAESRLVVERILSAGRFDVRSVLVTTTAWQALAEQLDSVDADVYVCEQQVIDGITGYSFHRGCLALVRRLEPLDPDVLLEERLLIALEGIGNPDNVGGIFRCAAAFGAGGVLLDPRCGDPLYRKAVRTSMGTVLQMRYAQLDPWPEALTRFRSAGMRLVALTPSPPAVSLDQFSAAKGTEDRLLLMLGAEGSGLSDDALQVADVRVRIPIDPAVDSLNVVVAAGIALDRLR